jgi:hypothetical protein
MNIGDCHFKKSQFSKNKFQINHKNQISNNIIVVLRFLKMIFICPKDSFRVICILINGIFNAQFTLRSKHPNW